MARTQTFGASELDSAPPSQSTTSSRSRNASSGLIHCNYFHAPVVIEFGSRYTKYGIGGEYTPRNIISSFTTNPRTGEMVHVLDRAMPEKERFQTLYAFLKKIMVKDLHIVPEEHRIVIVENLFVPSDTKKLIAKILFEFRSFLMPSLAFVPSPLMNSFAFGTKDALVVDIGCHTTSVFPVFDSVVLFNDAYEENGVGGAAMAARISEYILKKGQIRDQDGTLRALNEDERMEFKKRNIVEDIIAKLFMVTKRDRAKMIQNIELGKEPEKSLEFAPDIEIPFNDRQKLIIPGYLRESAAECFFEEEEINGNIPIPELALSSLIKAPVDTRRALLNNIIITGSAARLPGMLGRFKAELKELLKETFAELVDEVKFRKVENNNNGIERYSSWLGGSLFADIEEFNHRYYTKDDWGNKKLLPDWTNMVDDIEIHSVPGMIVTTAHRDPIII